MSQLNNFLRWNNLRCIVRSDKHNEPVSSHCHEDFYELVVVRNGAAQHVQSQKSVDVCSGSVLLIHPGEYHAYEKTANLEIYNILFDNTFLDYFRDDLTGCGNFQLLFRVGRGGELPLLYLDGKLLSKVIAFLENIIQEESLDVPGSRTLLLSNMLQVMLIICRLGKIGENVLFRRSQAFAISRVLAVLDEQFYVDWSLEDLAKLAGCSVSTFRQQFTLLTNCSPIAYLLDLRLGKAALLLELSHRRVGEIAGDCGFKDSNYFARSFREKYGISPREYRNKISNS